MRRKRVRDAITGLFVKPTEAQARPGQTVTETVSTDAQEIADLKWRLTGLQAQMREAAADVDLVARRLRDGAQAADDQVP